MIRRAIDTDIPQLLTMGREFAEYLNLGLSYSDERSEKMIRYVLSEGCLFVSETDGRLGGLIGGALAPVWYTDGLVAAEMALWVSPDCRGGRTVRDLIKAFEDWGKSQGAEYISLSDLCIDGEYTTGGMFQRLGYEVVERAHIRRVI